MWIKTSYFSSNQVPKSKEMEKVATLEGPSLALTPRYVIISGGEIYNFFNICVGETVSRGKINTGYHSLQDYWLI
jgi:hypothetical protein